MKRTAILAALPLALVLGAGACRNPSSPAPVQGAAAGSTGRGGPAALVTGTVLDARTGKPISGAKVTGPGGVVTESDAQGRFVLRGLTEGAEGELVGTTAAGLSGKNRLRTLAGGTLEVVLYLR